MGSLVTVRYWAGARRAAGRESEQIEATSVGELRGLLSARPGLAAVVVASSILVDSLASTDETPLDAGAVVDVLPPFAGG
ncbi:MAG TPA: MoaD/ThiS family protein [Jatrophihabitans sp.]|jgi:molybdopterin converting factor small subunit